jgi:hypothetical protein
MSMKRWEQLYVELERKAEKLGYDPPTQIGSDNSQTFEYRINNKPVLLIAFRDLGLKPGYTRPDRLWAEGLDLVLERYLEIVKQTPAKLPPAIAVVIDNIAGSYVIVPMNELIELYRVRMKNSYSRGNRKLTFVVERSDDSYFLVMPHNFPAKPLINVNNMTSVVELLKSLRK